MITKASAQKGKTDWELLFKRLQQLALSGKDPQKCRRILAQKNVWSSLSAQMALQWSRLAQAAGENEIALQVLNWMQDKFPEQKEHWQEHYELLLTLGKHQEAAQLRAKALTNLPELNMDLGPNIPATHIEAEDETPDRPFRERHQQECLLECYLELFKGRDDCFARQWANKKENKQGYVPVRRALELEDVREHLLGHKTYGIYLLNSQSLVSVAALDMDVNKSIRENPKITAKQKDLLRRERDYILQRIPEISKEHGLNCLTEFSGNKGFHFWYFFRPQVEAPKARTALQNIINLLKEDVSCFNLEVFPKQDKLSGKGLGNLVKLPLGIHRLSGKKSYFLPKKGKTVWDQLTILENISPIQLEDISQELNKSTAAPVIIHPRHEEWSGKYPELAFFLKKCPPLAQIILTCRSNRALSMREEKIILGTLGFLTRSSTIIHALFRNLPEYNQHLVDYKLSRVRGTPLGCKKIHTLLSLSIDYCSFDNSESYAHPLLHCPQWYPLNRPKAEKIENLQEALQQLQDTLDTVRRFLPSAPGLEKN